MHPAKHIPGFMARAKQRADRDGLAVGRAVVKEARKRPAPAKPAKAKAPRTAKPKPTPVPVKAAAPPSRAALVDRLKKAGAK